MFWAYAAIKRVLVYVHKILKSQENQQQKDHPQSYKQGTIYEAHMRYS
jgi:hypothetical protein